MTGQRKEVLVKLRYIQIQQFKNLRDFEIHFAQNSSTTVLLGQNGTGKSNLLEALIIIFRNLDLGASPEFTYILDYECRGNEISIQANHTLPKREQVQITIRRSGGPAEAISYSRFWQDSQRFYLPSYVFGYYSGPSNRMEKHFDQHQNRFYQDQLRGEEEPRRPLFYARSVQSQFALLAFFIEAEQEQQASKTGALQFLKGLLGIEELISVYFILHEPPWTSKAGDARFWNARGVLGEFLGHLYESSLAPRRRKERITSELGSTSTLEHLHLYLKDEQALKKLFAYYNNEQAFFKALESTYISKVLKEVRIRFRRSGVVDPLTFSEMSDGEQQLLMVLGLLRFTKEDEALFLLDEPDTHLNPSWSVQYFDFMKEAVGDLPTSHVIMTTHDPLVVSGLKQDNVRIMQRWKTGTRAEPPREDPQGMGVSGVLTSELFGLRTALDAPTQRLLDEQRVLAAKESLTYDERERLSELTGKLDSMGFSLADDDSPYAAFLKKWYSKEDPAIREHMDLTPEQQQERKDMIDHIIQELSAEGRWK